MNHFDKFIHTSIVFNLISITESFFSNLFFNIEKTDYEISQIPHSDFLLALKQSFVPINNIIENKNFSSQYLGDE